MTTLGPPPLPPILKYSPSLPLTPAAAAGSGEAPSSPSRRFPLMVMLVPSAMRPTRPASTPATSTTRHEYRPPSMLIVEPGDRYTREERRRRFTYDVVEAEGEGEPESDGGEEDDDDDGAEIRDKVQRFIAM